MNEQTPPWMRKVQPQVYTDAGKPGGDMTAEITVEGGQVAGVTHSEPQGLTIQHDEPAGTVEGSGKIYEQFDGHFKRTTAYAILGADGEYLARVVFKHPGQGVGRLYAYFQIWGAPMVRSSAAGSGFDKFSAALCSAASKLKTSMFAPREDGWHERAAKLRNDILKSDENSWRRKLESLGYRVLTVIEKMRQTDLETLIKEKTRCNIRDTIKI